MTTGSRTALLSVYHKPGIINFAKTLVDRGFDLLASGGTAQVLGEAGLAVTDVADIVGQPILGHRVVTLSREIHAGLLARDVPEDRAELERLKVPWIDLVCVGLYPLEEAIAHSTASSSVSVVDMTDVGGPTLIRSAAKGRRIVICDPADRFAVLDWLFYGEQHREQFISQLVAKAEMTVAKYCLTSALYHQSLALSGDIP